MIKNYDSPKKQYAPLFGLSYIDFTLNSAILSCNSFTNLQT